jgi:hypothetical protein
MQLTTRGGAITAALAGIAATATVMGFAVSGAAANPSKTPAASAHRLPVKQIESIERADGTYSKGVLTIDIDRDGTYHLDGTTLAEDFEVQHELYFQSLNNGKALFNGELAVPQARVQRTISAIEKQGLVFQAMHQHFLNIHPMVWFIHFRGTATPQALARRVHAVVEATDVTLPQTSPKHPTTSLPAKRLARILGGTGEVEAHGVVNVDVDRNNTEILHGHKAKPDLGIAPNVEFMPLGHGRALVVPDFGMTTSEVQKVTATMLARGWTDECLYNQESGEHPQLYWSHMVKKGSPISLARQVRQGLDHMNVEHSSN